MKNTVRNTAGLKHGNPGNKGGTGRPPDWLKEKCKRLIDRKKIVERLAQIAAGENVDSMTTIDGRLIPIPAPMTAQVKAAQELLDRGYGKPEQQIESTSLNEVIEMMRKKYA